MSRIFLRNCYRILPLLFFCGMPRLNAWWSEGHAIVARFANYSLGKDSNDLLSKILGVRSMSELSCLFIG